VTTFFPLQSRSKCNGYIVLFFSVLAKCNGYIIPHVWKALVLPVPLFQAEHRRWSFVTIVLNDRFETMKRLNEFVPTYGFRWLGIPPLISAMAFGLRKYAFKLDCVCWQYSWPSCILYIYEYMPVPNCVLRSAKMQIRIGRWSKQNRTGDHIKIRKRCFTFCYL
jgi:hypothetical protein